MSEQPKKTYKKVTLPPGTAIFPNLHTPSTKFDAVGVYDCKVRVPRTPEVDELIESLSPLREEALAMETPANRKKIKIINAAATIEEDDEGNETGFVIFKAKLKAAYKDRKTGEMVENKPPLLVDASRKVIPPDVRVWGGSKVVMAVIASGYAMPGTKTAGVSLKLRAVQVLELVSGGDNANDMFEEHDGFSAPVGRPQAAPAEDAVEDDDDF